MRIAGLQFPSVVRIKSVAGLGNTGLPPISVVYNNSPYRSLSMTKTETKLSKTHSNLFVRRVHVIGKVEGTRVSEKQANLSIQPEFVY